jgi:oligopeptide/dipeptide ABC transporter ATP-binding protein
MSLLEVEDLRTQFPTSRGTVEAVDGVDLTIESGEIVGLVGESGSGKTVLAESVVGLVETPGEIVDGDVRLHGDSLLEMSETERREIRGGSISLVFQDPMNSLNPTLTVGEQIAETVRLHQDAGESVRLPAEIKRKILGAARNGEAWRRAIEMLEAVEIPEPESRAEDFPHEFSGGMRQRAMIAMALAAEPDLLIADEPTTALDVTIQAQILDELRDLKDEFDASILIITHDLGVVAEVCDRVNVMYAGEVVERAPAAELFENPQHPYTQGLIASTPRIDDPREELEPIRGTVPELVDIPYACHFAPRCPEAKRECYEIHPDFRPVGRALASAGAGEENDTRAEDARTDREAFHEAACLRRGPEEDRL